MSVYPEAGFSLIELIMVIVVVAIASVPILGQFTQVASSALVNEEIQTASQLAQEGAEAVLAIRRDQGYAAVIPGVTTDVLTGKFPGYSRRLRVTETTSPVTCPTGATCKSVQVSVSRNLKERSVIMYVLMDY